jgi:Nif-specific regulatory protein
MQQTTQQAYLIIHLGNRWTDIMRLNSDQKVVVGRASDNQIVVRDERVSRKHAEISTTSGGWTVRDLGSRNGTLVDGQAISGSHPLADGETMSIGGCRITFALSLASGFSHQPEFPLATGASLGSDKTVDGENMPTIVQRRSHSQWSSSHEWEAAQIALEPSGIPSPLKSPTPHYQPAANLHRAPLAGASNDKWNFFYRLVFELVTSDSPERASQVALDRLLQALNLTAGGVVVIDRTEMERHPVGSQDTSSGPPSDREPTGVKRDFSTEQVRHLPPMAVLAARQPSGSTYHRVSDFLVDAVLAERQAVLARNVQDDSQLSLARESARRDIVSIICAPLRVHSERGEAVLGILHVYSSGDERVLTDADLDLTVGVADNLAIALSRQQASIELSKSLQHTRRTIDHLQEQLDLSCEMVGSSRALQFVRTSIRRAAPTSATVLIRGESGVGKELVTRAIHRASQRKDGPLVCLNCAALAPTLLESELFGHEKGAFTGATERKIGKFEAADGGTLMLDEIGEMHPDLQAKFLRVLEGHPFERIGGNKPIRTDVRVIAATNRDLEAAVQAKEFRSDLYYRLRVIEILVPPLRERLEDVQPLVEYFINQLRHHSSRRIDGIEPKALELLSRHLWPGNIRELKNVIERAVVLGNSATLRCEDFNLSFLGEHPSPPPTTIEPATSASTFQPVTLAELEQGHILAMLEYAEGNKSKASQLLGIERSTLDRKLKRFPNSN